MFLRRTISTRFLAACLVLIPLLSACSKGGDRPNLLFIFVDTLRPDRLGAYGGERPVSPTIDELGSRGALFEDALAPAPWTLPSSASMLTGLHPFRHGAGIHDTVRHLGQSVTKQIAADVDTLAMLLSRAGYQCEAYTANTHLRQGLAQGFDRFVCRNTEGSIIANYGVDRLQELADDSDPFFLMLHFMDVHDPLLMPSEEYLEITSENDSNRLPPAWARTFSGHDKIARPRYQSERMLAYDAAIHYVDRNIARVLAELKRLDLDDDTLIVFTSDHGEEVYDHFLAEKESNYSDPRNLFGIGHGHSLFVEQLWVPLIFTGPGIAARRIPNQVTLMDIVPTVLDYLDVGVPEGLDGRSLRPLAEGGDLPDIPLLAGSLAYGPDRKAWITPRWKLILGGSPEERILLFNRAQDRKERKDVAAVRGEIVEELTQALLEAEQSLGLRQGEAATYSADELLDLEALGYVGNKDQPASRNSDE